LNDYGLVTFHYSYAGVGSTQINAYNFSHDMLVLYVFFLKDKAPYSRVMPSCLFYFLVSVCHNYDCNTPFEG
jgi:hypothetical protein